MPRIYQVDSFADAPFEGNPAGVCVLDRPADEAWMQAVAAEMNLSETAFVHRVDDGFGLRWFTPEVEVELCGHATLATAHILWETEALRQDEDARFMTASGLLTATVHGGQIEMDFPATATEPVALPDGLAEALAVEPLHVTRNRHVYLLEVPSEMIVREMSPDFEKLRGVPARGFIVTSRAAGGADYDFVSRFFAPALGINEDPVTGSAHCALGPYWGVKLDRGELVGNQVSSRGGRVRVGLAGERVRLGGRAVTVLCGDLMV